MGKIKIDNNNDNLFSINYDFKGYRDLENTKEIVEYKNNSTMRIWYNVQTTGFESHWHNALEIILPIENEYEVAINNNTYTLKPGEILFPLLLIISRFSTYLAYINGIE